MGNHANLGIGYWGLSPFYNFTKLYWKDLYSGCPSQVYISLWDAFELVG